MYHDWVSLKINDVLGQFFPKQKRFTTCSKYRIAVFFHKFAKYNPAALTFVCLYSFNIIVLRFIHILCLPVDHDFYF